MILVDSDIVAYRHAYSAESRDLSETDMKANIDEMVDYIAGRNAFGGDLSECKFFLTGKTNFRNDIATIKPYKGHRKKEKPPLLSAARKYLAEEYNATYSNNQEADDDIAIMAASLDYKCTIASIDKDFLQVPCRHYNWNKDSHVQVTHDEGMFFFYTQMLTGDTADNIRGVPKIGPKKAEKILDGITDELELYGAVAEMYDSVEEMVENGRLLWLRRYEGEMWDVP